VRMIRLWYCKMNIREKGYMVEVILLINSIISLECAMDISGWFVVPFFLGIFIGGTYLGHLRCSRCGTPIMKNELKIFGLNTHIWKPIPLKKCAKCGYDLTVHPRC
jgi:hypothetical protein